MIPDFQQEIIPLDVPASTLAQPIPIDANGDLKVDLLGMVPDSEGLKLWKNVINATIGVTGPIFEVYDWHYLLLLCFMTYLLRFLFFPQFGRAFCWTTLQHCQSPQ